MWTYSLPLALLIATSVMVSSASPVTSNDLIEDYEDLFYPEGDRVFHRNGEDEDEWGDISEVDTARHLVKRAPSPLKKLPKLVLKKLPKLTLKKLPLKKLPKLALKKLPLKKLLFKKLGKREAEDYDEFSDGDKVRVFHGNEEDEEEWGEISEVDEPRHLVKRAPSPNLFPFKKFKKLAKLAPKKLALKKLPKLALKKLPKLALKKLPLKKLGVKKLPLKKLGGTGFAATQIIPRGARLKKLSKFALPLGGAGSALPLGAAGFAATQIIPRGPSLPRPRFRNPFSG